MTWDILQKNSVLLLWGGVELHSSSSPLPLQELCSLSIVLHHTVWSRNSWHWNTSHVSEITDICSPWWMHLWELALVMCSCYCVLWDNSCFVYVIFKCKFWLRRLWLNTIDFINISNIVHHHLKCEYVTLSSPSCAVPSALWAWWASWVVSGERKPRWARWRSLRWTGMLSNQRRASLRSWPSTTEAERGKRLAFSPALLLFKLHAQPRTVILSSM